MPTRDHPLATESLASDGPIQRAVSDRARQLLPTESYVDEGWFTREQKTLFARSWGLAGVESEVQASGDYVTAKVGRFTLLVLRGIDGELRAFHNICRHRGTELVDPGCGNTGRTIVCPYHRWTFGLDGALRGVPDQKTCFPDIDKARLGLHPASVGVLGGLVFVNPDPGQDFDAWVQPLRDVIWPHDLSSPELEEFGEVVTYDMACNWKVFVENALDGYHLAYLHEHTLGGPTPDRNIWDVHGEHLVWYATEDAAARSRTPNFVTRALDKWNRKKIAHAATPGYGGVHALFPTTLIVANPWSVSVSNLEPVSAERTLLHVRVWAAKSWLTSRGSMRDIPGYDPTSKTVKSSHWGVHPLETGDFQTEDIYVVEKMQRAMASPKYAVSALAQGAGGEASLTRFQALVARHMAST